MIFNTQNRRNYKSFAYIKGTDPIDDTEVCVCVRMYVSCKWTIHIHTYLCV